MTAGIREALLDSKLFSLEEWNRIQNFSPANPGFSLPIAALSHLDLISACSPSISSPSWGWLSSIVTVAQPQQLQWEKGGTQNLIHLINACWPCKAQREAYFYAFIYHICLALLLAKGWVNLYLKRMVCCLILSSNYKLSYRQTLLKGCPASLHPFNCIWMITEGTFHIVRYLCFTYFPFKYLHNLLHCDCKCSPTKRWL